MTTTLAPALDEALDAREGRSLYRLSGDVGAIGRSYLVNGRRTTYELARQALAAGTPVVVPDVKVCKLGLFFGMGGAIELLEGDFLAVVERFGALLDGDVFEPPVRVDHGWSVRDVVGWHEDLRTAEDVDPTTNELTLYLVADWRITELWALDAIERGTLRKRSAEFGSYLTNEGVEYPFIYYGCAFVDIPAVEGLGPVGLSRQLGAPSRVVDLTSEGAPPMAGATRTRSTGGRPARKLAQDTVGTPPVDPAAPDPATPPVADPAATPPGDVTTTPPSATATPPAADPATPPADPATPPAAPAAGENAEVAALRAELAAQRQEQAGRDVLAYQGRGVVVPATLAAAKTLLGHAEPGVRDAARAILDNAKPPVALGQTPPVRTESTPGGNAGSTGRVIELGMTPEEVGPLWAGLTREERKERQSEYDEWRAAQNA